jgi:hypothetical protein
VKEDACPFSTYHPAGGRDERTDEEPQSYAVFACQPAEAEYRKPLAELPAA